MTVFPTGSQYHITAGDYDAVITEVGATLRSLTFGGDEVLHTFREDEAPRSSMGRQLVPWPNRIRDGRYTFEGRAFELPLTEPARHNALHGLGEGVAWQLISHTAAEVVLATTIYAQKGWDAVLEVEISHRVDAEDGLCVAVRARNVGSTRAPFGYGAHPYFAADLASASLTHAFAAELEVDPERLLPIRLSRVTAEHDFRGGRVMADTELDTAFTDVRGEWAVSLGTAGRTVTVWADETLPWGQLYTPPTRDAIAIEPMTCGPDAFNEGPTHDGLIVLDPGAGTSCTWGVRVTS